MYGRYSSSQPGSTEDGVLIYTGTLGKAVLGNSLTVPPLPANCPKVYFNQVEKRQCVIKSHVICEITRSKDLCLWWLKKSHKTAIKWILTSKRFFKAKRNMEKRHGCKTGYFSFMRENTDPPINHTLALNCFPSTFIRFLPTFLLCIIFHHISILVTSEYLHLFYNSFLLVYLLILFLVSQSICPWFILSILIIPVFFVFF